MIFDVRFRPPYRSFLNLHVYSRDPYKKLPGMMGVDPAPSVVEKSVDLALEERRNAGITKSLVVGRCARPPYQVSDNDDVLGFVCNHPDSGFYAVPAVDPADRRQAIDELEALVSLPEVKAVHLEPGFSKRPMKADDAKIYPLYDFMERCGLPLLISAGGREGPDMSYVDPLHIHHVATDFPDLKLVMTHGGYPYVQQALFVAFDCLNVYVSPDMYLNIPNMPGSLEYVRAANYYLSDRLLFGTAYPVRPLIESVEQFNLLPFDEEVREKVLYSNAARLFGDE